MLTKRPMRFARSNRSVRFTDTEWDAIRAEAKARSRQVNAPVTPSAVVRDAVRELLSLPSEQDED